MPELTDAQKVVRNDTAKRMADALEALAGTGGRGLPAGGTDGDVLVKNGSTDYDGRWTNTPPQMGSLATIEPTSTVTQKTQYVQGEYLVYNGQLYKVTASTISQGGRLDPTPGSGNIEAVSVGSELNQVTPVALGGTGGTTPESALSNLLGMQCIVRLLPTDYQDKITRTDYSPYPIFVACCGNNDRWKLFDMLTMAGQVSATHWAQVTHIVAQPENAEVYCEVDNANAAIYIKNRSGWNMGLLFFIYPAAPVIFERNAIS